MTHKYTVTTEVQLTVAADRGTEAERSAAYEHFKAVAPGLYPQADVTFDDEARVVTVTQQESKES